MNINRYYSSAAHEVIHSIIDFLFPPACPLCGGALSNNDVVCPGCKEAVTLNSLKYSPSPQTIANVDNVSILLPYDTHCRKLIHSLKYHGMPSVGLFLGELMGRKVVRQFTPPENTLLVPVPLHPSKLRERGYNQSERLAGGFVSFTEHTIEENIIVRTRATPTQTALDIEGRNRNVLGAFRYNGKQSLKGRPVVIIDDVLTTGSTVSECARALKEGGAGTVTVAVAATPDIGED